MGQFDTDYIIFRNVDNSEFVKNLIKNLRIYHFLK
jgi:hypothetical protein